MSTTASLPTLRKRLTKQDSRNQKKRWAGTSDGFISDHQPGKENKKSYHLQTWPVFLFPVWNSVGTKFCCWSDKTGFKAFPGVWLSLLWRWGKHTSIVHPHIPEGFLFRFHLWSVVNGELCVDQSWWRRGAERNLRHSWGQFPAWGRLGVEGDQLHTQHRLIGLGNVFSFPNV